MFWFAGFGPASELVTVPLVFAGGTGGLMEGLGEERAGRLAGPGGLGRHGGLWGRAGLGLEPRRVWG